MARVKDEWAIVYATKSYKGSDGICNTVTIIPGFSSEQLAIEAKQKLDVVIGYPIFDNEKSTIIKLKEKE